MYARRVALVVSAVIDADSVPVLSVTEIGSAEGDQEGHLATARVLGVTADAREALILVELALDDFLRPDR